MPEASYVGRELPLFAAEAQTWKRYWHSQVAPFVRGEVAEVGAGVGANASLFADDPVDAWIGIEPDAQAARIFAETERTMPSGMRREWIVGTLAATGARQFDTVLYLDVLEHIDDDRGELRAASDHLRPGGHLIVLAPAHAWLFSPFDAAIGHRRRYTRASLAAAAPPNLRLVLSRYLDCAGVAASAANAVLLRQSMPTDRQLRVWDRWLVPASRILDRALAYRLGKSVLGVWRRTN